MTSYDRTDAPQRRRQLRGLLRDDVFPRAPLVRQPDPFLSCVVHEHAPQGLLLVLREKPGDEPYLARTPPDRLLLLLLWLRRRLLHPSHRSVT